ncbi:MAG TPA: hypothetical protein VFU07_05215 [Candidatus Lumbricidophila sp.]|nr:hypothetical protein [Candidatus Lumbricidophila sp.]
MLRTSTRAAAQRTTGAAARGSRLHRRIIAALIGVLVIAGGVFGGASMATADDSNKDDLSLYAVSSNVAGYFASALAPDADGGHQSALLPGNNNWAPVRNSPASAGGLLAYADKDFNPVKWLMQQATGASQVVDTSAIDKLGPGVTSYVQFGSTLRQLGLDSMGSGFGGNPLTWIAGALLALPFTLASSLNFAFQLALTLLDWLNPFKLLFAGVNAISPQFAQGMVGGTTPDLGPLQGLASFIGGVNQTIASLSWAVLIPVFIVLTVVFLLLGKGGGGLIKKLVVRVMFIVIGVPLLGSMYTNIITDMKEATAGADSGATQVVASTFVDFEAWATKYRLAVPNGATIQWDVNSNQPTGASSVAVQDSALAINKMTHPEWANLSQLFTLKADPDWAHVAGPDTAASKDDAFESARLLLERFMSGNRVDSSSFASSVQGELARNPAAKNWFTDLRDGDLQSKSGSTNPVVSVAAGAGLQAPGINPDASTRIDRAVEFETPAAGQSSCGARVTESDGSLSQCSMSALSLYNYLNTSFGPVSDTLYSSNKASSSATMEVHNAVSLVGTGFGTVVYWFNALVLLWAFVFIGYFYAIAMFIGNFRHGIQILTAVPFATLGAIGAITKVIVYTVAMVLELLVTIFLYKIVQELLLAMPKIFSHFASVVMTNGGAAVGVGVFGIALQWIVPILAALVVGGMTIVALRLRKTVVKAITEAATKVVEALVGGQSNSVPGGHKGGKLAAAAGGVAAGAGMALGGRMMGGGPQAAAGAQSSGPETASASGTMSATPGDSNGPQGGGVVDINGPDGAGGTGGGAATGEGAGSGEARDQEIGLRISQNGLTPNPADAGSADGRGVSAPGGKSQGAAGGDMLDNVYEAGSKANEQQKSISRDKRQAALQGAAAGVMVARAVARGTSGDAVGAVGDGAQALSSLNNAQRAQQRAATKQKEFNRPTVSSAPKQTAPRSVPQQSTPAPKVSQAPKPAPAGKPPAQRKLPIAPPTGGTSE